MFDLRFKSTFFLCMKKYGKIKLNTDFFAGGDVDAEGSQWSEERKSCHLIYFLTGHWTKLNVFSPY